MSKSYALTLALAAGAAMLASASAQAGTPWVDKRQNAQAHSIFKGVVNGRLTFRETKRLARGQARVRAIERNAKADGVVTPLERLRLHGALSVQRARIYHLKHN